jgi:hypothetical protein
VSECDEAEHGQVGAILRKHGVTRTRICGDWRRQYHDEGMAALAGRPKKELPNEVGNGRSV